MRDENMGSLGNIRHKSYSYMPLNQLMDNSPISTPFIGIRLNLSLFFSSISSYLIALSDRSTKLKCILGSSLFHNLLPLWHQRHYDYIYISV